mgnify:CR=1 FL=1
MKSKYKLSFCIVTCNQPIQLERLLNSLKTQDLKNIEIIIRDDSKDNKSKLVVDKYLNDFDMQYYHLNAEGIDVSIQYVVKKSNGQYVWMFGDDILEPDAFKKLKLQLESNNNPDFVYLNSSNLNKDMAAIMYSDNVVTNNKDDFLMLLKDQLGFISALVFKRSIVTIAVENDETVVGTHWLILYCSLFAISQGKIYMYLSDIYICSDDKPAGEARWYDSYDVHAVAFAKVVVKFKNNFSRGVIRNLISYKFNISWKAVAVERALGFHTGFASHAPKIRQTLETFWSYPICYFVLLLFMVPRKVLSIAYYLMKKY